MHMKRKILLCLYSILFLSLWGCQIMETVKKDLNTAYHYIFKGGRIRDTTLKQDLNQTLSSLGMDKVIYPHANDPNSRYIRTDKPIKNLSAREKKYSDYVHHAAKKYRVDPALVFAVIRAESGFNPNAKSPAGAQGLMQLMPQTAKDLGVKRPFDPEDNINGGTLYLRLLSKEFENRNLVLAAYNSGPGNVKKYGERIPPFAETKKYVTRVNKYYRYYKSKRL